MRAALASGLVLLAACGGGGGPTITLDIGVCVLAAVDRGDGWERLPAESRLDLEVSGPFALVSVCPGVISGVVVDVQLATLDDLTAHTIECAFGGSSGPELEIRLDSYAAPEARTRVAVGGRSSVVDKYDTRVLEVRPGLTDRLAIEEYGPRFLVDRDVEVDGPGEWVVRMERDGIPLEDHPIAIPAELAGAEVGVETQIAMNRAELTIHGRQQPTTVQVLPADVLRPTDTQRVHVEHVVTGSHRRWFAATPGIAPIEVRFPDPLGGVGFGRSNGAPRASWDDDRTWPLRRFVATENDPNSIGGDTWVVTEHPHWTGVAGGERTSGFPDLTAIPGFDSSWTPDRYVGRLRLSSDPDAPEVVGFEHSGQVSSR